MMSKITPAMSPSFLTKVRGPIQLSQLKIENTSVSSEDSIVGYFDILGFSYKCDWEEMKLNVLDFSGALSLVAREFPHVRINAFSDCAFVYTTFENIKDFFAGIRYAFTIWLQNGVLVRGGIAIGSYYETEKTHFGHSLDNFTSSQFYGSGIALAVRNENGKAPFLFVDKHSAKIIKKYISEPIFAFDDKKLCYAWSNNPKELSSFTVICFIRLLMAWRLKKFDVAEKMKWGIIAAMQWHDSKLDEPFYVLLLLFDSTLLNSVRERNKLLRHLNFLSHYNKHIALARSLEINVLEIYKLDIAIALADSSLNGDKL